MMTRIRRRKQIQALQTAAAAAYRQTKANLHNRRREKRVAAWMLKRNRVVRHKRPLCRQSVTHPPLTLRRSTRATKSKRCKFTLPTFVWKSILILFFAPCSFRKPPETVVVQTAPPQQLQQQQPQHIVPSQPIPEVVPPKIEEKAIVASTTTNVAAVVAATTIVPQDTENNNTTSIIAVTKTVPKAPEVQAPVVPEPKPVVVETVAPTKVLELNDSNNNKPPGPTGQPLAAAAAAVVAEERKPVVVEAAPIAIVKEQDETDRAAVIEQDTNNNSAQPAAAVVAPITDKLNEEEQDSPIEEEVPAEVEGGTIGLDYDGNQWSPLNIDGKKYYTRDQLMLLKDIVRPSLPTALSASGNVVQSLIKDNKDQLTNTLTQSMPPVQMGGPGGMQRTPYNDPIGSLQPSFMKQLSGSGQGGRGNMYPKRPSQQGNNKQQVRVDKHAIVNDIHSTFPSRFLFAQMMTGNRGSQNAPNGPMINLRLSLQGDVKLNESDNAWKPTHLVKGQIVSSDAPVEDSKTEELIKRFRSLLNKLTPENFELLVEQVKILHIDSEGRLNGIIILVFEKAVSEPNFAPMYARLCKEVANIFVMPDRDGNNDGRESKKSIFKIKLITQCQKEFERHNNEHKNMFRSHDEK